MAYVLQYSIWLYHVTSYEGHKQALYHNGKHTVKAKKTGTSTATTRNCKSYERETGVNVEHSLECPPMICSDTIHQDTSSTGSTA